MVIRLLSIFFKMLFLFDNSIICHYIFHWIIMQEVFTRFIAEIKNTSWLEFIAVVSGIASVWYSRAANILVYPVGLVNTVIYIFISLKSSLFGEASVNLYYTVMSIYGWLLWAKKNQHQQ